jgi:transcriptional regulator with XRE-family HTH domain
MYAVMDGERIRAMREERGLSRQELAKEAGIGMSTLRSVECGERVRATTSWRGARVFGAHPSELGRRNPTDAEWRRLLGLDK